MPPSPGPAVPVARGDDKARGARVSGVRQGHGGYVGNVERAGVEGSDRALKLAQRFLGSIETDQAAPRIVQIEDRIDRQRDSRRE